MLSFFMKHRGSVSILMAIILLPSLAAVSLLVDMANRSMSKAVVESAGELAASSALANYDTVLEDVYGLFAVSQTEEELTKNLQRYIQDTLSAANLLKGTEYDSDTMNAINEFVDEAIHSALAEDNGVDVTRLNTPLIRLDVENVKARGVDASALSNPQVLQGQIIEFMKYRGPAEVGMDLLGVLNSLKSMKEKSQVTQQQMEVEEKLSDLAEAEKRFYEAILECDRLVGKIEDALKNLDWDSLGGDLLTAYSVVVRDGLYRADLGSEKYPVFSMEWKEGGGGSYHIYKGIRDAGGKLTYTEITRSTDAGTNANLRRGYIEKLTDPELETVLPGEMNSGAASSPELRRRIQLHYAELELWTKDYALPLANYSLSLAENARELEEERDALDPEKDRARIDEINAELAGIYAAEAEVDSPLFQWMELLNQNKAAAETYVGNTASVENVVGGNLYFAWEALNPLYEALKEAQDEKYQEFFFSGKVTAFNLAIALGERVIQLLQGVAEENETLKEKTRDYEDKNGSDDFSAKIAAESETVEKQNTEEAVREVLDQLQHIENYLFEKYGREVSQSDYAGIWEFVGNGYFFLDSDGKNRPAADEDLKNGQTAKAGRRYAARTAELLEGYIESGSYDLKTEFGITAAFSNSVSVLKPGYNSLHALDSGGDGVFYLWYDTTSANPKKFVADSYLKKISEAKKDTQTGLEFGIPRYYVYLASTYGYSADEAGSNGDNTQKNISKVAGKAKEQNQEAVSVQYDGSTVFEVLEGNATSPDSGGDTEIKADAEDKKGGLEMVKTVFSGADGILGALEQALEAARDGLLTTQYIYENFSNYIMAKEGKEEKTMTNVAISKENNVLYGCEVEYILYGERGDADKGPEQNIDKVRNRIFVIRFLCNGIFALTNSEIQAMTIGPALAIQAATLGVFPYKVAQIILDVCLALAESIYDVAQIMDGEKIAFIKTNGTWVMSASGAIRAVTETVVDQVVEDVIIPKAEELITQVSEQLQEFVEQGVEYTENKVNEVTDSAVDAAVLALTTALEDAVSGMMSSLTGEIETIYQDILCHAEIVSPEEIKNRLTQTVNGYITDCEQSGTINSQVADFLRGKSTLAVEFVLTREIRGGMSIQGYLDSVGAKLSDISHGASLNPKDYQELAKTLGKIPQEFLEDKVYGVGEEIKSKVSEWTSGLGSQVQGYLDEGIVTLENETEEKVSQLTSDAANKVKGALSDKIDEYFPGKGTMKVDCEDMSGGGLAASLKFGYLDYLRLFLFLKVAGSDSDAVLTRVGEVITLNLISGLKNYHTATGTKAKSSFSMSEAYTYVAISADVTVDPLLINKDLVKRGAVRKTESGEYESVDVGRSSLWQYTYMTLAGY